MAAIPHPQLEQHHRHHHHQQLKSLRNHGADAPINAPIPLFYPSAGPDQSYPNFVHVMGLAPGPAADGGGSSWWEPRQKRMKEQEFLDTSPQISSLDFMRSTPPPVSTGLALSLDDRHVMGGSSSSGNSPAPLLDEELSRVVLKLDAEMDHYVKVQSARLRSEILEQVHVKQLQALVSIEGRIRQKFEEKESEVESINKRNADLEEQMKQASFEATAWQQRAKYNENVMAALKQNLQQVQAQCWGSKEGCGDSEVDDTASCCNGQLARKEDLLLTCRVCKVNEVCMLLLPCRHLCLCKECEGKLSFCPLCQSSKFVGMEIYM